MSGACRTCVAWRECTGDPDAVCAWCREGAAPWLDGDPPRSPSRAYNRDLTRRLLAGIPPYDAWCYVGGDVEPLGSHWTVAAALEALGHMGGGGVSTGLTFITWHPDTDDEAKRAIRAALKPHGVKAAPREGAADP